MKSVFRWIVFSFVFLPGVEGWTAQQAGMEEKSGSIILRSGGAEYILSRNGALRNIGYRGKQYWYQGSGAVLKVPDGWIIEDDSRWKELNGNAAMKTERIKDGLRVTFLREGKALRLTKCYRLHDDEPALEMEYCLSLRGDLFAEWGYLPLFNCKNDTREWFHIGSEVRNGEVVPRLFRYPESPFFDWKTNSPKRIANEKPNWNTFAVVGQYDKTMDRGILFSLSESGNGEVSFYCGGAKDAFLSLRYPGLGPGKNSWVSKKAEFRITPFSGCPSDAVKPFLKTSYVNWMKAHDLIAFKQKTGTAHPASIPGIGIWSDDCSVKIFREEKEPARKADAVFLTGARREGVTFQIAVRPYRTARKQVRLDFTDLRQKNGQVISGKTIRWNPLGYVKSDRVLKGTQLIGEIPDVLLEQEPTVCPAGQTQPFWIRIPIPPEAASGVYHGTCRILDDKTELAVIPLNLKVWNFTLPDRPTLLSLINPWPHRIRAVFPHDSSLRGKAYRQIREITIDAGGGWICRTGPEVEWNADGEILRFDTTKMDRELEQYFRETKARYMVNSFARFGAGGAPFKKGFFGLIKEINTPLWEKRVANFAVRLQDHLKKKGLLDRVILDVFDEPKKQWILYLKKNLETVRKNAPGLKMTYPGHYHPELDGLIDYWQMILYPEPAMCSPELRNHFQSISSSQMVYNPANFEENSPNSAMRGLYWWMWRMGISGWLQWCTTIWHWADNNPGWNAFNNASWIAVGPQGLRSTMRMEMCRKGNDDYEYLNLLVQTGRNAREAKLENVAAEAEKLIRRAERLTRTNGNLFPAIQNAEELISLRNAIGDFLDLHTPVKSPDCKNSPLGNGSSSPLGKEKNRLEPR